MVKEQWRTLATNWQQHLATPLIVASDWQTVDLVLTKSNGR